MVVLKMLLIGSRVRLITCVLVVVFAGSGWLTAQSRQIVEIVAERFAFAPSRITVPVGTTIEIHIRSEDTNHGFRLVDGPNVIIPKRRHGTAVVVFEATEIGEYRFECSKLCGAGHNFMKGEIVVAE